MGTGRSLSTIIADPRRPHTRTISWLAASRSAPGSEGPERQGSGLGDVGVPVQVRGGRQIRRLHAETPGDLLQRVAIEPRVCAKRVLAHELADLVDGKVVIREGEGELGHRVLVGIVGVAEGSLDVRVVGTPQEAV